MYLIHTHTHTLTHTCTAHNTQRYQKLIITIIIDAIMNSCCKSEQQQHLQTFHRKGKEDEEYNRFPICVIRWYVRVYLQLKIDCLPNEKKNIIYSSSSPPSVFFFSFRNKSFHITDIEKGFLALQNVVIKGKQQICHLCLKDTLRTL